MFKRTWSMMPKQSDIDARSWEVKWSQFGSKMTFFISRGNTVTCQKGSIAKHATTPGYDIRATTYDSHQSCKLPNHSKVVKNGTKHAGLVRHYPRKTAKKMDQWADTRQNHVGDLVFKGKPTRTTSTYDME
ncbi:hypothetical protein FNV43_RR10602 [Rhamnella rubrinervis]|uniref:Uncharacterized protein n=1 Tax=Rhamnella rubrinervis TaxID=2594499 RepID=A0A8K0H423_9ROSA|nr:hypothetical protein FNV43_RR10602 [Rhamnella rubrinervis]